MADSEPDDAMQQVEQMSSALLAKMAVSMAEAREERAKVINRTSDSQIAVLQKLIEEMRIIRDDIRRLRS